MRKDWVNRCRTKQKLVEDPRLAGRIPDVGNSFSRWLDETFVASTNALVVMGSQALPHCFYSNFT